MLHSGIDSLIISSFCLSRTSVLPWNIPRSLLWAEHSHFHRTDCVQTSCTSGAYEIVRASDKMGHQKIALVTGPPASCHRMRTKKGYLRALWKTTIFLLTPIISSLKINKTTLDIRQCRNYGSSGTSAAVFSANYTLCLSIYEAIYSLGIRIPEDLSVVSFDDFELSMLLSPQLTAVRQPLAGLAEQACDLLLRRLNGDYCDFPRTIRLKPECIYRDSVRNLFSDGK